MYQRLADTLRRFLPVPWLFRHGFNWSPMYRRTTARITAVSDDLHRVNVRLPISWRNRNYVGTIFGGSLYAMSDPIYMIQLVQILGPEFVVWDKAATIRFRRPARSDVTAEFVFTADEIRDIRARTQEQGSFDVVKQVALLDVAGATVAEVTKTIYVATKAHYRSRTSAPSTAP